MDKIWILFAQNFASVIRNSFIFIFNQIRAGHATILSRQRDHVFSPQSCYLLQYYSICLATSIWTPKSKYFSNFLWSLRFYYVVALSHCRGREAKKLSRAQQ